jgi:hypothetical protein
MPDLFDSENSTYLGGPSCEALKDSSLPDPFTTLMLRIASSCHENKLLELENEIMILSSSENKLNSSQQQVLSDILFLIQETKSNKNPQILLAIEAVGGAFANPSAIAHLFAKKKIETAITSLEAIRGISNKKIIAALVGLSVALAVVAASTMLIGLACILGVALVASSTISSALFLGISSYSFSERNSSNKSIYALNGLFNSVNNSHKKLDRSNPVAEPFIPGDDSSNSLG